MKFTKPVSSVLLLTLLNLSVATTLPAMASRASADVTSTLAGEKLFIKVSKTSEGATPDDTRIKFEKCQIENPTACDPIGSRDYSISELRLHRDLLEQEANKAGAIGFTDVIGTILGVVGGAGTGVYAGSYGGAAIIGQSGFEALGAAVVGMFVGAVVVAVVGGIVVYKVIRHHKKKKAKKLKVKAATLDDQVIEGQPVSIAVDVDTFAKSLSDILASLPTTGAQALP